MTWIHGNFLLLGPMGGRTFSYTYCIFFVSKDVGPIFLGNKATKM